MKTLFRIATSDADLVREALADEPRAFEALVLRYQRKVHAVARALGVSPSSLDDVVQESFLRAFRELPALRAPDSFGPWLLQITRNLARKHLAEQSRALCANLTEALASDRPSNPQESLETREIGERLWRQVEELPDGIREAVLLYYYDGESTRAVARTLGTSTAAVRNRLMRGRDLLRESLWRELKDYLRDTLPSRREWKRRGRRLALATIAAVTPLGRGTGSAAAVLSTGALIMTTKQLTLLLVAAALLLSAGILLVSDPFRWRESMKPAAVTPERTPASAGAETREGETPLAESPPKNEPPSALLPPGPAQPESGGPGPVQEAAARGSILARVTWAEDGTPAAAIHARLIPWESPEAAGPYPGGVFAVTGADGTFRADGLHPGKVGIYLDRGGGDQVEVKAGAETEVAVEVPLGLTVRGNVIDKNGNPAGGAGLWLSEYGNSGSGQVVAATTADGSFELRSVGPYHFLGARAAGHAPSDLHPIQGSPGATVTLELVLPGAGGAIAGRVLDPEGVPVAGARVLVGAEDQGHRPHRDGTWVHDPPPLLIAAGADGRFEAQGIASGKTPVAARAPGLVPWRGEVEVSAEAPAAVEIQLQRGASLAGTVTASGGGPAAGAYLGAQPFGRFITLAARAGADGSYVLEGLAAGEVDVEAGKDGAGKASARLTVRAGETARWDPVLAAGPEITGRVLDEEGAPLSGWVVNAIVKTDDDYWRGAAKTDAGGSFSIQECRDRGHQLTVYEPECAYPSAWLDDVRPATPGVLFRITAGERASAFVTGTVFEPDGSPATAADVRAWHTRFNISPSHFTDPETGSFRIGPLPPARYRLEVEAKNFPPLQLGEHALAPGQTLDLGKLVLEGGATLEVTIQREDGKPAGQGPMLLVEPKIGGRAGAPLSWSDGKARSGMLAPGTYRLQVVGRGEVACASYPFEIETEKGVELELALKAGVSRTLRFREAPAVKAAKKVDVAVHDAQGGLVLHTDWFVAPHLQNSFSFAPGSYTVEAAADSGARAGGAFEVGTEAGGGEIVELLLR